MPNIPNLNLPSSKVAELVPASVAFENRLVPLADWGGMLIFASDTRLSEESREKLLFLFERKVTAVLRSSEWVSAALHELYDAPRDLDGSELHGETWYWIQSHHFASDGTLVISCSGCKGGTEWWSGAAEFSLDHKDYRFWKWVVTVQAYRRLVPESEVPAIKRIWRRYLVRRRSTPNPLD
jgi:hypothetical protein